MSGGSKLRHLTIKTTYMRKNVITLALAAAGLSVVLFAACTGDSKPGQTADGSPVSHDSLVKRGEYLVGAIGCDDCHTPKKMGANGPELDLEHRFSGHPATQPTGPADTAVMKNGWVLFGMGLTTAVGPWGQSYAANITSDSTGIGTWTEDQFLRCIRKGLSKGLEGNRPLLPPMPWQGYRNLSDDDLKAVFAYLKTTKPVENVVPQPKLLTQVK